MAFFGFMTVVPTVYQNDDTYGLIFLLLPLVGPLMA